MGEAGQIGNLSRTASTRHQDPRCLGFGAKFAKDADLRDLFSRRHGETRGLRGRELVEKSYCLGAIYGFAFGIS